MKAGSTNRQYKERPPQGGPPARPSLLSRISGAGGSLAISISKNPAFHKVPNGDIGLTSWYPEAKKPANGTKNGHTQQADEDDEDYPNDFADDQPDEAEEQHAGERAKPK